MSSRWNAWLEATLALDLTVEEHRLALALARCVLGWNKTENDVGRKILRDTSRLHGRSFERARDGLVEKGLLRYEPGTAGRGNRGVYELILDHEEKAAQERPFTEGGETAAQERPYVREKAAEKAAPQRPRREKGEGLKPLRSRAGENGSEPTPLGGQFGEQLERLRAPASGAHRRGGGGVTVKPSAADLLERSGALLSRTHLRELGLERRAIDAVFRACPVVSLPGYTRPMIRAEDYLRLLEESTYAGDRVRP